VVVDRESRTVGLFADVGRRALTPLTTRRRIGNNRASVFGRPPFYATDGSFIPGSKRMERHL